MSEVPTLRIVPGAPPPAPLTKSQLKKKRKAAHVKDEPELDSPMSNGRGLNSAIDTALVDHAPAAGDLNSGLLTKPEDMANTAIASETASEVASILPGVSKRPTSAIVELVNKRHRTLHKKIQRIKEYSSKPVDTLNEDQRRSLATLPQLEASSKEVEEVRKAIEVHEAEEAAHEAKRLAEIESIVKQRIADAVAEARSAAVTRTIQLVTIIRELPELRQKYDGEASLEKLSGAIHGGDQSHLETTVGLFVAGQGDYTSLVEILNTHLAPAAPTSDLPTPEPEEEEPETPAVTQQTTTPGFTSSATMSSSFQFIQESDLLDEPIVPEAQPTLHNAPEAEPTEEDPTGRGPGAIDWSAEHQDELPPIAGLQEHFGASGQATPVAETPAAEFGDNWSIVADAESKPVNEEDDGFTTIPNRRGGHGQGDWRGGDRGRGRGGFRGRGTGEWRSGEGHTGGRGGYRGSGDNRGRGDFRGRARGDWKPRGEYRGRGEGRGEGRGGYRGRAPAAEGQS